MSIAGVWLMAAVGVTAGPMPDGRPIGSAPAVAACSAADDPGAIVVCGQQAGPSPRLPLREDRAANGEVTRYASDGAQQDPGPPVQPSRLGDTLGKLFGIVKGAATGADRGF